MIKIFKEYIFAVLATLSFLIILIGALIQSQIKTQTKNKTELCNHANPTTQSICLYQLQKKEERERAKRSLFDLLYIFIEKL